MQMKKDIQVILRLYQKRDELKEENGETSVEYDYAFTE